MKFWTAIVFILLVAWSQGSKIDFQFESTEDGTYDTAICQIGDVIEIHLDENPSTGFTWLIPEEKEHFNMIWSIAESKFVPASDTPEIVFNLRNNNF